MPPTLTQRLALLERPPGYPVMRQRWSRLLFAHWPVAAELLQATLPPGLHVDTFKGQAWLGIVPFYMESIRPVYLPPLPLISWFLEMNVRTYVHDDQGRAGVWFYTLDCNQPVAVEIARRVFRLNYLHASMSAKREGDLVRYQCQRHGTNNIVRYAYRPQGELRAATPGSFEFFLVERYLLFSIGRRGQLHTGRVHHSPYTFADAICEEWSGEPLRQAGFPLPVDEPASLLYSPGVDVTVYPLQ